MSEDGMVLPFDRARRGKGGPPAKPELPPEQRVLNPRVRKAAPGARALAAEQAAINRERYAAAVSRQEEERLLREGTPVPARITIALDIRGLEGDWVDEACGAEPPYDVDLWECGLKVPTAEQVRKLADLTGFPIKFFYMPIEPGPLPGDGPIWICWGGRRGCEAVKPHVVDEHGVLHYNGEPRQPPTIKPVQSALF